jgi:chromosome partitioning protein
MEFASQVIHHGRRRYQVCQAPCRHKLLERLNSARLRPVVEVPCRNLAQLARSDRHSNPAARNGVGETTWQRIEGELSGRPRVLAVFNQKGGTGKTTTSVTLAAGLASCDRRVLLVDTDAQGNVGVWFDLHVDKTLYNVLAMGLSAREAVVNVRPNLDVLPSNEGLAAAELYLSGRQHRDRILSTRLESMRTQYDHIIVDCSPSLSLMNQNALVFADAILCPVACDYLSLIGVRQVLRTIKHVNRLLSHPVRLWGVLPTLYDARARVCTDALETLRLHFAERCLEPIRVASRVKEAPSLGRTLFEHAPDSTAARDYLRVVARLLSEADSTTDNSDPHMSIAS